MQRDMSGFMTEKVWLWIWIELQDTNEDSWNILNAFVFIVAAFFIAMMIYTFTNHSPNDDENTTHRIAMISTHGYFDTKPTLGRTDTGGQIVYILNLVKSLSNKGSKVDIFTRWFDANRKQVEDIPGCSGCRLIRIPCGPWQFIPKEALYDYLDELSQNMISFIKKNNLEYDLYHGHYVDGGIVTLNVSSAFKRPSFFTPHSLGAWKKEQMHGDEKVMEYKYKFKRRIFEEQRIFDIVNCVVTTTSLQKQKMKELMHYENDKVNSIPCGVNVHYFKPKPFLVKNKKKYVFCLSRIDTNKGHDLLLYAWSIVLKHMGNVHLIIGGGSKEPNQQTERAKSVIEKMKQIIKENKMENNVHLIGYVETDALLSYYRECEFFVVPSLFEPFGITALEAMASRKCVLATKFGGISTIITHEKDGLLVDTTDAQQFASTMIRLLKDDALRHKLEENAYRTVHARYSWNIVADQHIALYTNVL